jgi:hypothetical protein
VPQGRYEIRDYHLGALVALIATLLTFSIHGRRRHPYVVFKGSNDGFVPGIRNLFELANLKVVAVHAAGDFVPCVTDLSGVVGDDLVDERRYYCCIMVFEGRRQGGKVMS